MIPAGAEYLAEEARLIGATPAVRATLLPYLWPNGVDGTGTFDHAAYVAPDRIQANYEGFDVDNAWISPVLTANLQVLTSPAVITWGWNSPGFDMFLYWRGADSTAALAAASWVLVNQGDTIQIQPYYQFSLVLTPYRAWAEDAIGDADDFTAWAEDSPGELDAYQGYAAPVNVSRDVLTYIKDLDLLGEFTIVRDIEQAGSVSMEAPKAFDDLVAGSHSGLLLNNRQMDGAGVPAPLFSPNKNSFVFGLQDWYGAHLRIDLGWSKAANWGTTGFWNFQGDLLDSSGKGHTLTWQGGGSPSYVAGMLPGLTAVDLDTSHYFSLADHADFNMGIGDFTIEIVYRDDGIKLANYELDLIEKMDAVTGVGFKISLVSLMIGASLPVVRLQDTSGYTNHYLALDTKEGDHFHYFAVTFDRDENITGYFDGVSYSTPALRPGTIDNTGTLYIGYGLTGLAKRAGMFDLVRIHKGRVLTAVEIAANYANFLIGVSQEVGISSDFTEFIPLFLGKITKWGPVSRAVDQGGQAQPNTVEVYAKDFITDCLQKRICLPAADGSPAPLTFGEFLCKGEAISGWSPALPLRTAYFESPDYNELNHVVALGGGAFSLITPGLTGVRAFRAATTGANQTTYGSIVLPFSGELFVTGNMRFTVAPGTPANLNMIFLQAIDATGAADFTISVDNTGAIYSTLGGQSKFNILAYLDVPLSFALWLSPTDPGYARLWINGDEILAHQADLSGEHPLGVRFGVQTAGVAENWTIDFDDIEVRTKYYLNAFQVAGGPFASIGPVYIDNLAQPDSQVVGSFTQTLTRFPEYGMVQLASTDPEFKPSGEVMIRVVENAGGRHALYIIEALLAAAGVTAYIDAPTLTAAYATVPDDIANARFEGGKADKQGLKDFASLGMTVADALKEITSRFLYWVFVDHGVIKVIPYQGTPPTDPAMDLTASNLYEATQIIDMDSLNSFVTAIFGWYARNPSLFYVAGTQEAGGQGTGLDYTWDSPVACESIATVKAKADLLLKFLSAQERLEPVRTSLAGARLELMEVVSVDDVLLGDALKNYVVTRKEVGLDPGSRETTLQLMRFLGK